MYHSRQPAKRPAQTEANNKLYAYKRRLAASRSTTLSLAKSVFAVDDVVGIRERYDAYWAPVLAAEQYDDLFKPDAINRFRFTTSYTRVCSNLLQYTNIQPQAMQCTELKWIRDFVANFTDQGDITTQVTSIKDYTRIVNHLMIIYAENNRDIFFHGSFATHLLNRDIPFADIDCFMVQDFDFGVTVCLLFHFILASELLIESIPYVKNLLKIANANTRDPISDMLHIDQECIAYLHKQTVLMTIDKIVILHPVAMFLNFFKMLPLKNRRERIAYNPKKAALTLETLWHASVGQIVMTAGAKKTREPEPIVSRIQFVRFELRGDGSDSVIVRIHAAHSYTFHFYSNTLDSTFTDQFVSKDDKKHYRHYRQFSSVLSEQFVYDSEADVYHVNFSRNELYASGDTVHWLSQYAILATIGLFDFITKLLDVYPQILRHIRDTIPSAFTFDDITLKHTRIKNKGLHMVCNPLVRYTYLRNDEELLVYHDK